MVIEPLSADLQIVFPTADVTTASFTNPVPQVTKPTLADGWLEAGATFQSTTPGNYAPEAYRLIPYGTTSDAQTFSMNVFGWSPTANNQRTLKQAALWVPTLIASFTTCTLDSAITGVAGSDIDNTHLFCRAITQTKGQTTAWRTGGVDLLSAAAGQASSVIIPTKGHRFIQIQLAIGGGTAVAMNCLAARM